MIAGRLPVRTCAAAIAAGFAVSAAAAAPLARTFPQAPQSAAAREAKGIVVFGQEQDVDGFNVNLTCCNQFWSGVQAGVAIRGAFTVSNTLRPLKDLVSDAHATKTSLSFTIRADANWNWGGRKLPVTYRDFVYTWRQLVSPANDVAGRDGYDQITGFTHRGSKQVTFTWKRPYADWRSLFNVVYPSAALAGQDFDAIWSDCICGSDGKPVADGPFSLTRYTRGQGSTFKVNPFWYGHKPSLNEVDFRLITDTNSEVQAMRGGELDAINPTFGSNLAPLKDAPGITYSQVPGLYQEHLDIQFGPKANPLLRAPWFRQAIMLGIDRASIIKAVYGPLAGRTVPLDSILYYQSDTAYRPDFARWSFDAKRALALLKKHCSGGPATVSQSTTATWTCAGYPAKIRYMWVASNATRTAQEAIIKQELRSIGIAVVDTPVPADVFFGPTGVPSGDYDLANFAWTTTPDPAAFVHIWSCGGDANYMGYCNRAATKLLQASDSELDPVKRTRELQQADALMAADIPTIPLYSRPVPLIHRSDLLGMKDNPSTGGFAWNIEDWHWKP